MEYIYYLSSLIERRNTVIRCHTEEEIIDLSVAVGVLYPGREKDVFAYRGLPGKGRYESGLCVRLERDSKGGLDLGYSNSSFYQEEGYTVVDYSELLRCSTIDFGEIDVDTCSVCDLLFGG